MTDEKKTFADTAREAAEALGVTRLRTGEGHSTSSMIQNVLKESNVEKTATLVKEHSDRSTRNDGCVKFGLAALYKLSEPYAFDDEKPPCEFMFVSSSTVMGEPETYAFPAKADGDCISWGELPGSSKGVVSHAEVLEAMGYSLVKQ